jgi:peptide/nickel transport system permease protein
VLAGALVISFLLVSVGGDPARAQAGTSILPSAQLEALRQELGYDKPILPRLGDYLARAVQGDFGTSYRYRAPAADVVLEALPNTLLLVGASLLAALAISVPLALYAVLRRDTVDDRLVRGFFITIQGMPDFWLGTVFVLVFAVQLGMLPSIGFGSASALILPSATLAIPLIPAFFRFLRSQLLDVMEQDFVVVLRTKGLSRRQILVRHGLRNALPAFVTYLALHVGLLIGGTVVVEAIFSWPGLGSVLLTAVSVRDLQLVQAVVVVVAVCFVVLNLIADMFVLAIDPRVRAGRL